MDAPLAELLVRLILAVLVTFVFAVFAFAWPYLRGQAVAPLYKFMTIILGMNAIWRWYVLWLGLQHDETGSWSMQVEPYIRMFGNALLVLLYVAIGLVGYFHVRRTLKKNGDGS